MTAEPHRPDGWIVAYVVEVLFDTNQGRTGYDHVGTVARCTCCGEQLNLSSSPAVLARHARRHEGAPAGRTRPKTFDQSLHVASVHRKEVTTEQTD